LCEEDVNTTVDRVIDWDCSMSETERTGDSTGVQESPSRDELFEMLSNRRRRFVLHYLCRRQEAPVDLSEVVTQVAAWENDTDPGDLCYDDRKSVHISLYQHHAPKMDEVGLVDYDQREGVLELGLPPEDVGSYLSTFGETGNAWELYFPALAGVVTLGAVVAVAVGTALFAWTTLGVVAFVTASMALLYDARFRDRFPAGSPPEVGSE
jgi:hypothetical protein